VIILPFFAQKKCAFLEGEWQKKCAFCSKKILTARLIPEKAAAFNKWARRKEKGESDDLLIVVC